MQQPAIPDFRGSHAAAAPVQHAIHHLVDNPIRAGILCLPAAAVLFLCGAFVRGPFVQPDYAISPAEFERWVVSPDYAIGWLLILGAMVLLLFGLLSLAVDLAHGRVRGRALTGLCLSAAGVTISMAVAGTFAFTWPSIGRHMMLAPAAFPQLAESCVSGPLAIAALIGSVLYVAGALLLAMIIWDSRSLPRWAGLLFLLHAPLLTIGATLTLTLEHMGAFFLLLAGTALAWGVRREEEIVRHREHHAEPL
jgi:hypothetical protein